MQYVPLDWFGSILFWLCKFNYFWVNHLHIRDTIGSSLGLGVTRCSSSLSWNRLNQSTLSSRTFRILIVGFPPISISSHSLVECIIFGLRSSSGSMSKGSQRLYWIPCSLKGKTIRESSYLLHLWFFRRVQRVNAINFPYKRVPKVVCCHWSSYQGDSLFIEWWFLIEMDDFWHVF